MGIIPQCMSGVQYGDATAAQASNKRLENQFNYAIIKL